MKPKDPNEAKDFAIELSISSPSYSHWRILGSTTLLLCLANTLVATEISGASQSTRIGDLILIFAGALVQTFVFRNKFFVASEARKILSAQRKSALVYGTRVSQEFAVKDFLERAGQSYMFRMGVVGSICIVASVLELTKITSILSYCEIPAALTSISLMFAMIPGLFWFPIFFSAGHIMLVLFLHVGLSSGISLIASLAVGAELLFYTWIQSFLLETSRLHEFIPRKIYKLLNAQWTKPLAVFLVAGGLVHFLLPGNYGNTKLSKMGALKFYNDWAVARTQHAWNLFTRNLNETISMDTAAPLAANNDAVDTPSSPGDIKATDVVQELGGNAEATKNSLPGNPSTGTADVPQGANPAGQIPQGALSAANSNEAATPATPLSRPMTNEIPTNSAPITEDIDRSQEPASAQAASANAEAAAPQAAGRKAEPGQAKGLAPLTPKTQAVTLAKKSDLVDTLEDYAQPKNDTPLPGTYSARAKKLLQELRAAAVKAEAARLAKHPTEHRAVEEDMEEALRALQDERIQGLQKEAKKLLQDIVAHVPPPIIDRNLQQAAKKLLQNIPEEKMAALLKEEIRRVQLKPQTAPPVAVPEPAPQMEAPISSSQSPTIAPYDVPKKVPIPEIIAMFGMAGHLMLRRLSDYLQRRAQVRRKRLEKLEALALRPRHQTHLPIIPPPPKVARIDPPKGPLPNPTLDVATPDEARRLIVELYNKLLQNLARSGIEKSPDQTPDEFFKQSGQRELAFVTAVFSQALYGKLPPSHEEFSRFITELSQRGVKTEKELIPTYPLSQAS